MSGRAFATKILHTKFLKPDAHGSLHMPVYDNVTFEFGTAEELERAFQGKSPAHMYSRISNPTVEHFEQRLKGVTGAAGVLALSSGMAAIANTLLTIARAGDNIITSRHLFGNTYSLLEQTLREWGLETRYADLTQPDEVARLIDVRTRAVFLETITNPQLEVADLRALSAVARPAGVAVIVDTTMTPPYLFSAKAFGIDVEVLSSTKWISGGATSLGGVIIDHGSYDWARNAKLAADAKKFGLFAFISRLRREVFRNTGACLSAHNAYLQSLGLETLALRVDQSCANTLKIAEFLQGSSRVRSVHYPGLASSPFYAAAKAQFGARTGAVLTFDLGSREECFRFINALQLLRRATNLHDNRTLVIHPASTIFCEYDAAQLQRMGVRTTMVRVSVGIEDVRDLIADIQQSLEALA